MFTLAFLSRALFALLSLGLCAQLHATGEKKN